MKMMAGKGLSLNLVHLLSPPKCRCPYSSQSVLHGEGWPESIRDLQPWEVTGQGQGPRSILMVAPGGCWVLIRENGEC